MNKIFYKNKNDTYRIKPKIFFLILLPFSSFFALFYLNFIFLSFLSFFFLCSFSFIYFKKDTFIKKGVEIKKHDENIQNTVITNNKTNKTEAIYPKNDIAITTKIKKNIGIANNNTLNGFNELKTGYDTDFFFDSDELKKGIIVKVETIEKIAEKKGMKISEIFCLNAWLDERFSFSKEFVVLTNEEKIFFDAHGLEQISAEEIKNFFEKENTSINDICLNENIIDELNLSEDELKKAEKEVDNINNNHNETTIVQFQAK